MFKRLVPALIVIASLFAQSGAHAAMMAYLYLSGAKSGEIKGSVTQKGRENSIAVIAVDHEIKNDSSGKKHTVFTITKELDRSSPLLYQALATNEVLKGFRLQFWTPQIKAGTGVGSEVQHYTVTLNNSRIVDIKFKMANIKNPELQKYTEYEEVSFVYESISWTWNDGGITASDSAKF